VSTLNSENVKNRGKTKNRGVGSLFDNAKVRVGILQGVWKKDC